MAARKPDALLLLDSSALTTPERTITVPGAARHLELGTGAMASDVLVPGEDTDILSTVALPVGLDPVPGQGRAAAT